MNGLDVIVAINNISKAKAMYNKGGLNATVHMGYGTKTYPVDKKNLTEKSIKKSKKK